MNFVHRVSGINAMQRAFADILVIKLPVQSDTTEYAVKVQKVGWLRGLIRKLWK